MSATPEHKSVLAQAIEAQGRHVRCVVLDGFFGPGGKAIPAIAFRVAVKDEEDRAIVQAHKYAREAAKLAGDAADVAAKDTDLLVDAKTIEALYRVCLPAEQDPKTGEWQLERKPAPSGKGEVIYNAFPTPSWMRQNLTTDQIAALLNAYLEVKAEASPGGKLTLDDAFLDALVKLCAEHVTDDMPELALARFSRTQLTHAFVMLADRLEEKTRAVEALLQEREAWEQERAELLAELHRDAPAGEAGEPAPAG